MYRHPGCSYTAGCYVYYILCVRPPELYKCYITARWFGPERSAVCQLQAYNASIRHFSAGKLIASASLLRSPESSCAGEKQQKIRSVCFITPSTVFWGERLASPFDKQNKRFASFAPLLVNRWHCSEVMTSRAHIWKGG